ncbi:MAG TPA: type VI secretion system ATPase TssH [Gammaproteobacteria bacterium]|nr:type VI secretion system ATPase TssH [Gammaproteobacteria bacterium]
MKADLKSLLRRLNHQCTKALEAASGLCVNRSHYEVAPEHLLLELLEDGQADVQLVLKHFELDPGRWAKQLQHTIDGLKSGNPGRPVFAPAVLSWIEEAWMITSLDLGQARVRSLALLIALADNPARYGLEQLAEIDSLSRDKLLAVQQDVLAVSNEGNEPLGAAGSYTGGGTAAGRAAPEGATALQKFTTNFTARAREGKIDPVFGRDVEIRQIVDILGRRRKNNPIAVGEAGVGKTSVVEGLALKVVSGDVPDSIKDVDIVGLDLGLLQAGASVKGEFENRLNAVITEIKTSQKPIILFIDEAHTLIGAGGAAGTGDAANLLKPALARGELRTIAATTWSEYRKYFEKDPALARRFQLVKLDEPSVETACVILRGIRDIYEKAHGIYITDDAIQAAASMSARYISGRQLPDKAVDLLDTACARVKISLSGKPGKLEDLERRVAVLERERSAIARDVDSGRSGAHARLKEIEDEVGALKTEIASVEKAWKTEKDAVTAVTDLRKKLQDGDDKARAGVQKELDAALKKLAELQKEGALVSPEVTSEVVARVVSDWTGVPVGNMVRDEAAALLELGNHLKGWVRGQDHALDAIDATVRAAKAGVQNPEQPIGVFLLVGPSGVGKTETAHGLANFLFGGDRFMVTINMSEFQEKHAVSRLIGSPPGYVGYGEGGMLTDAVRQRPYSVVLLDEVEKAHPEIMNLFYQVFDKGVLNDSEGRVVDFKNTVILMTSNLGSDVLIKMGTATPPATVEALTEAIRPELQRFFKPALLARMKIVPFYPITGDNLKSIIRMKLDKVGKRLKQNQGLVFSYTDKVVEQIAARCTDVESGARNIDHIVNGALLPLLATRILEQIGDEQGFATLALDMDAHGEFAPKFGAAEKASAA